MSTSTAGTKFTVICRRCGSKFEVIRNWGGGIRRADDQRVNPAQCQCGSQAFEVF